MNYTIENFKKITFLSKNKETVTLNGYSFMDEYGHCFCIIYGEKRRNLLKKYLSNKNN